jgi:hypothetical protein
MGALIFIYIPTYVENFVAVFFAAQFVRNDFFLSTFFSVLARFDSRGMVTTAAALDSTQPFFGQSNLTHLHTYTRTYTRTHTLYLTYMTSARTGSLLIYTMYLSVFSRDRPIRNQCISNS